VERDPEEPLVCWFRIWNLVASTHDDLGQRGGAQWPAGYERREYQIRPSKKGPLPSDLRETLCVGCYSGPIVEALRLTTPRRTTSSGSAESLLQLNGESAGAAFCADSRSQRFVYRAEAGKTLVVASPKTFSVESLRRDEGCRPAKTGSRRAGTACQKRGALSRGEGRFTLLNRIAIPMSAYG